MRSRRGVLIREWFIWQRGTHWFEDTLLHPFAPITIAALLVALVLMFPFQAANILGDPPPRLDLLDLDFSASLFQRVAHAGPDEVVERVVLEPRCSK